MKFAYDIPDSFWSLFRSMNRELYMEALLKINEEYEYNNYYLSKEVCLQVLEDWNESQRIWLSPEEFEKYLIENYFKDNLKFEYILSSDPRYTKDSYIEIMKLMFSLRYMEDGIGQVYKDIDFGKIPEKYNDLIKDYNEKR